MGFFRRTTAPDKHDKNYIKTTYGGKNRCIAISTYQNIQKGLVLPNCVGYVHGRWLEMYGESKLTTHDAYTFWGHTSDGYQRSQTPVLGAVMCWGRNPGEKNKGHVCIVEKINYDGNGNITSISTSNSAWQGSYWYTVDYKYPFKWHTKTRNYFLQGFILPPNTPAPVVSVSTGKLRQRRRHFKFVLFGRNSNSKRGW